MEVDPQELNPNNVPMPTFEIELTDHWIPVPELMEEHQVFAVLFVEQQIRIEIDANDVFSVFQLDPQNEENNELIYSTPIVSPQLTEDVKEQFRQGMPEFEVMYSRFAENNEENNASTITLGSVHENNSMNGGRGKDKRSLRKKRTQKRKNRRSGRTRKVY